MIKYALFYLLALACLAYGFVVGYAEIFPYQWIITVKDEIAFIKNDLTGGVERFLTPYGDYDPADYESVKSQNIPWQVPPLVRGNVSPPGNILLYGTFDFDPPAHAAVLLDENNSVRHVWRVNEDAVKGKLAQGMHVRDDAKKFPHGIDILPDGSIIFAYDVGVSMQRFDACNQPVWTTPGSFHHSLSVDAENSVIWALLDGASEHPESEEDNPDKAAWRYIAQLDLESGKIERRISLREVIDANPEIDILGIRQADKEERSTWEADAFHENDIEVLPSSIADAFPQFSAGDLLLSMRALDLIMVLDPETKKVKWWRIGQTRRQHDADWQPSGVITAYNNNMHRGPISIVQIDPRNFDAKQLYNGKASGAKSNIRGRHQVLPNGSILITVPDQGRALEVTPDGRTTFEFLNRYESKPGQNLLLSEARWIPSDYFDFEEFPSCEK